MTLKEIGDEAMRLAESGRASDEDVRRLAYLIAQLTKQLDPGKPEEI